MSSVCSTTTISPTSCGSSTVTTSPCAWFSKTNTTSGCLSANSCFCYTPTTSVVSWNSTHPSVLLKAIPITNHERSIHDRITSIGYSAPPYPEPFTARRVHKWLHTQPKIVYFPLVRSDISFKISPVAICEPHLKANSFRGFAPASTWQAKAYTTTTACDPDDGDDDNNLGTSITYEIKLSIPRHRWWAKISILRHHIWDRTLNFKIHWGTTTIRTKKPRRGILWENWKLWMFNWKNLNLMLFFVLPCKLNWFFMSYTYFLFVELLFACQWIALVCIHYG